MSELIVVEGLSKEFLDPKGNAVRAVNDVSFRCGAGAVYGLLGLNGAGKTTTLRMLSTVLAPTEGTARLAGHDILQDPRAVRASIGFLSGTTGLYHRLTARETLRFFGEFHGLIGAELDARVARVLELFEIGSYADQRCDKLSTGMKQKVNIGRAVVHDPPILILDEPTSGLDVLAASTTIDFVRRCRDEGKCVLFSTHIMSEAEKLCDRIGVIHRGTLRAEGTLAELRESTGEHYLEDVFRKIVTEDAREGVVSTDGA